MIVIITSCFASRSTTTSEEIHVKWNNNNYLGIILNVDGSCLGSPVRAGFGGVIRNDSEIHVKWNNNNYLGIILNVDGSCLGSPVRAGFGGVIRNDSGFYLSDFSGFIQGSSDILLAELFAIYTGFTLAKNMAIDELVCYSDSFHSINLIKGPSIKYHVYAVLIQDIK
ncbi:hypothetical protein TSUD_06180 [Trifolium subterraneum]|uniref:RNase H type-1 domain-containing protein n=1 Tax=Trifolium subterraneum TaxID=3900 RepID=A0A2Z6M4S5_TRISU|nr:hypothetical protein TSUD_06180 [Trifolium subterraneum]